jgi:type 1 glutamine amidotransferase
MKRNFSLILIIFLAVPLFALTRQIAVQSKSKLVKVLIFSGKNNHEWQKTTPLLVRIFKDSQLFDVTFTNKPDTFSYGSLKKFQLIVSNWNSWPDNKMRMSAQWESDFVKFVNQGGGVLSFHAGASSFYDWEAYHKTGIGRWGKDTSHGPRTKGHVYGLDQTHPITKGIGDFLIMDEVWEKTDIYPGAISIGSLSAKDEKDGHLIDVPAVFVSRTGKGRTFFTTLGHDERALLNSGFQLLFLRAAQWCAGKAVTIEVPSAVRLPEKGRADRFNWNRSDTTVSLRNNLEVVWQYNYNNRYGKPYFHPLTVNHSDLTCVSPPDHPWHLGLWFSWKFINGINYWEYIKNFNSPETGYKSEGITEIDNQEITTNPDYSSDIRMNFSYRPIGGKAVLKEARNLHISKPSADGSYFIDEEHIFNALSDSVLIDRTPISGEPGGQSWGGYAGLSIRFNQDYTSPVVVSPVDSARLLKSNWLYMGFNTLKGEKAGISILTHPQFTTGSTSWYVISDPNVPFYYYSPAILFDRKILLKKGEPLHLNYRIWMLPGEVSKESLQLKYEQYLNK